jgi:UDP-glucose 4-epimerase
MNADGRWHGTSIRVLDNMSEGRYRSLMALRGLSVDLIEGDLLDRRTVEYALEGVDSVLHLAAIVRTPMSFFNPVHLEQVNHWGTANLVAGCLDAGVGRLVFTSSAAVYGPGGPFDEASRLSPIGPYAESKASGESTVLRRVGGELAATVLRIGTLYGLAPAARFHAVVNRLSMLAGLGKPLTIFASGEQQRPVVHVTDAARAALLALAAPVLFEAPVYNVVEANPSVLDLVAAIQRIRPSTEVRYTRQQAAISELTFAASATALRSLGWEPSRALEEGVEEVIEAFSPA